MGNEPGVNTAASPTEEERIKNLQAEFSRKLDDVKGEIASKFDALAQKLDGMTTTEEAPPEKTDINDPKSELIKISRDPLGYVREKTKPLEEKAAALEKELIEQRKASLQSQWERMEDRIARAEKKNDWNELPEDLRKEIRKEIIDRQWAANPASAMDAYEIVRARRSNTASSDPDRLRRIRENQGEGAGRGSAAGGSARSISNAMLDDLSATMPSHPDYKKNMETLDKVQKGLIKVEG